VAVRAYPRLGRSRWRTGDRLLLGEDGPAFAPKFTCAFHGWVFEHDGSLSHVPYRERFASGGLDDPACTSLRGFRVESFAGWTWSTGRTRSPPPMGSLPQTSPPSRAPHGRSPVR